MAESHNLIGRDASEEETRAFNAVRRRDRPASSEEFAKPIDWLSISDQDPPTREWAIDYWLGMGHVTLLAGLGGTGKSLFAQQLASTLALGRSFIDTVKQPRRVLIWAGEDDHDELWRRQHNIAKLLHVELSSFYQQLMIYPMHDKDCAMMDVVYGDLMATSLCDLLHEQIQDYKADVVVLDNISKVFGGNENDRHDVTRFLALLAKAGGERNPAMLLIGHVSKAQGSEFSGSTAWENAVRSRIWFSDKKPDAEPSASEEEATDDIRYVARRKANYSARDMRTLQYLEGAYVCRDFSVANGGFVDALSRRAAERVLCKGIEEVEKRSYVATDATCKFYLPHLLIKLGLNEQFTKKDLEQAMHRLIRDGKVERKTEKSNNRSQERVRLVVKQAEGVV